MRRGYMMAVAGMAIVATTLTGCSTARSTTGSDGPSSASGVATAPNGSSVTVSAGAGQAKVMIDGKDQAADGRVMCTTAAGVVTVVIGQTASGYTVSMTDASPPEVQSVMLGLGNMNGFSLVYNKGSGEGNAQASKNGGSYKVTGNASGVDSSQGMQPVTKSFEIDVTCP
jgi:ipoprotein LpqH